MVGKKIAPKKKKDNLILRLEKHVDSLLEKAFDADERSAQAGFAALARAEDNAALSYKSEVSSLVESFPELKDYVEMRTTELQRAQDAYRDSVMGY